MPALAEVLQDRLSVCNRQGAVLEALAEVVKAVDTGMRVNCPMSCRDCPACIDNSCGRLRGCAFVRLSEALDAVHWSLSTAGDDE
ncbi:MAG TPA: hypothetical protein PKH75_10025 [Bacillota bacterium]|jgi:hypothetical protein|nr:hypothetical protein [Bacillota bacterium]